MKWSPCDCGKHYGDPMVGAFWTMVAFFAVSFVVRATIFLWAVVDVTNRIAASVAVQCGGL